MKRTISYVLSLITALLLLVSCGNDTPPVTTDTADPSTSGQPVTTEAPVSEPVERILTLAENGSTGYVIIRPSDADEETVAAVNDLASSFSKTTGAEIKVYDDTASPSDLEIIVGNTSRPESAEVLANGLYTGYEIKTSGSKIILWGSRTEDLKLVCKRFMTTVDVKDGVSTFSTSRESRRISEKVFADLPRWQGGTQGIYTLADKAFEVRINGTDKAAYDSFISALENSGLRLYDTNEIGSNSFATFTDDSREIHAAYYGAYGFGRIIAEPLGYLPTTEAASYEKKVTPTVTMMAGYYTAGDYPSGSTQGPQMLNASGSVVAFGMSYLVQLEDGSFVMIDGGSYVPRNSNYEGNQKDVDNLVEKMIEMNRGTGYDKPKVIWILTHSHSDHMQVLNQLLVSRASSIDITMVCYNFPDYSGGKVQVIDNGLDSHTKLVTNFKNRISQAFPKCTHFVFHAGQKLVLPGCTIDFLLTHEDYIEHDYKGENGDPYIFGLGNLTSSVFRFRIADHTFLVTADSEFTLVDQLVKAYGAELKSDILQVQHHGYSGGTNQFSQIFTDSQLPTICLWSTDAWRFNNDNHRIGQMSPRGFNHFNYMLRDSDKCFNFHAGHDVTVSFEDLSVSINGVKADKDDLGRAY